jgi:hypothetical protein
MLSLLLIALLVFAACGGGAAPQPSNPRLKSLLPRSLPLRNRLKRPLRSPLKKPLRSPLKRPLLANGNSFGWFAPVPLKMVGSKMWLSPPGKKKCLMLRSTC